MIKLDPKIASLLCEITGVGYFCDYGAIIGNAEFIIYFKDGSDIPYLAHITEFEQDGILIKVKE